MRRHRSRMILAGNPGTDRRQAIKTDQAKVSGR
jgi:hypothetical protein